MPHSCLSLVTQDPSLASDLQAHLQTQLGHPVSVFGFQEAGRNNGQAADALILVVATTKAECAQVSHLARRTRSKDLPPILILQGEACQQAAEFTSLDRYVSCRLHWPEEAKTLVDVIRQRMRKENPIDKHQDSLAGELRRRLLEQTPSLGQLVEPLVL